MNIFTGIFESYDPKIIKTHIWYCNWYKDYCWLSRYPHINYKAILEIVRVVNN